MTAAKIEPIPDQKPKPKPNDNQAKPSVSFVDEDDNSRTMRKVKEAVSQQEKGPRELHHIMMVMIVIMRAYAEHIHGLKSQ
jgi:hypothetical protein